MTRPLRVNLVLEDTVLFGGVKVALQVANGLAQRGHRVTVVSRAAPPPWFRVEAAFRRSPGLEPAAFPAADVTVATYWTTLAPCLEADTGVVVHFCQGFEFLYSHNSDRHPEILEAYRRRMPTMTVSGHLARHLGREFGRPARVTPCGVGSGWRATRRRRPRARPRILVVGPFEIDWKGAPTALEAARRLRRDGVGFDLVRLSQWPLTADERALFRPDEFHCHVPPHRVPRVVRGCDLLLAPSREPEGFGLPVLEAMACGVPVVASDVSCFREFARTAARLVPPDDPRALAEAARELLAAPRAWQRQRREGLRVAARFSSRRSIDRAEQALLWAHSGEWTEEVAAS